jgi:3-deoxy-manno-octulosonate cytidylyltransferase (CMP-KDO synthetase)
VNVQGDEPFVSEEAVQRAASLVSGGSFPVGTAAAPISREDYSSPDVVKVVFDAAGRALYFSRAPIPALRDEDDAQVHEGLMHRHIGIYAYTREALLSWVTLPEHPLERVERLEQLRPLAAGLSIGVAVVDKPAHPGIDTEADLAFANEHWNAFTSGTR